MLTVLLAPLSVPAGPKSAANPRWACEEPYVVAVGKAPKSESYGPMVTIPVTEVNGVTGEVKHSSFQMPKYTREVPTEPTVCPVWKDKVPWKSFTTVVDEADLDDAIYSCEFVHGGGSVSKTKKLPGGKVAIRSDYNAW